ncbi:MAG TPA: hypothetical protein VHB02_19565 [Acidimicrobiales bacterium]|nr:hypothetical protein [Acidimicrobiales bacterium]
MVTAETRPPTDAVAPDADAVIREARRRRRRRWLLWAAVTVVVAAAVAGITATVLRDSSPPPGHPTRPTQGAPSSAPGAVPPAAVRPDAPGALAVAPDGGLYVADDRRNEILERLPGGAFGVVAGTGTAGFAGDGGPATAAEIDRPGGMVVAPDGTLYFADAGNGRVRAVSPAGIITTVVGGGGREGGQGGGQGGSPGGGWVVDGTPAGRAALSTPTAVALSPAGELYVADGQQVLAVQPDGTLTAVLGHRGPLQGLAGVGGPAVDASADGAAGLAFDGAGDLFVFGEATKSVLMVTPDGTLAGVPGTLYPRGYGGLASGPAGTVLAMDGGSVVRLTPAGEQAVVTFPSGPDQPDRYLGIRNFTPAGIAVGPDGTVYVDTNPDGGFADASAIAAVRPDGAGTLLWRAGS